MAEKNLTESAPHAVEEVIAQLYGLKTLITETQQIGECGAPENSLLRMGGDFCLDAAIDWLETKQVTSSDVSNALARLYDFEATLLGARAIAMSTTENGARGVLLQHALSKLTSATSELDAPSVLTRVQVKAPKRVEVSHG